MSTTEIEATIETSAAHAENDPGKVESAPRVKQFPLSPAHVKALSNQGVEEAVVFINEKMRTEGCRTFRVPLGYAVSIVEEYRRHGWNADIIRGSQRAEDSSVAVAIMEKELNAAILVQPTPPPAPAGDPPAQPPPEPTTNGAG